MIAVKVFAAVMLAALATFGYGMAIVFVREDPGRGLEKVVTIAGAVLMACIISIVVFMGIVGIWSL